MGYQAPEFAPWDGQRVPVTLLGGYLGAGKTTILNEVLKSADRPITVLVNDVGEINIDAAFIRRRNADTVELTDGCICCSLSGGLAETFAEMILRPEPPAHVVIELSGVADPSRVAPWARTTGFRLDGVVVAFDPTTDPEEHSELTRSTIESQLRAADLVLLTKLDRVAKDGLDSVTEAIDRASNWCHRIRPGVPVVTAPSATANAAWLSLGGRGPGTEVPPPTPSLFDSHFVETVALVNPTTRAALEQTLAELPPTAVRAKGIGAGRNGERYRAERVGQRVEVAELSAAEQYAPTDLVVIHTTC